MPENEVGKMSSVNENIVDGISKSSEFNIEDNNISNTEDNNGIINFLSEDLINKIAAGEVIERPASVVKELIENSLDAGATKIVVEISDCGKEAIIIRDNGKGMVPEDAEKSIVRHATSKIKTSDDLFAIQTLGFRGEALASIAAVSKLRIITKKKNQLEGYSIAIKAGTVIGSGVIAADEGTTIKVENLFFNTPARKNFLKTDAVELRHIINVIMHYALLHENVSFTLSHDDRELINSPAVNDARSNISSLYGVDVAKELVAINFVNDIISISGFVGKPYHARNDKNQQALFVNERWIRNEELTSAVYDAYHSMIFVNKHPIFVLKIKLNPAKIDVNVHPTKSEIKIEQSQLVSETVCKAIKETLQKHNLLPVIDLEVESSDNFAMFKQKPKYGFEQSKQTVLNQTEKSLDRSSKESLDRSSKESLDRSSKESLDRSSKESLDKSSRYGVMESNLGVKANYVASEVITSDTQLSDVAGVPKQEYVKELNDHITLPPIKLLGQIHKTFFAAETLSGMFFIDQHAAHERVLYEQFMQQYMNEGVTLQNLLQPEVIDIALNNVEIVRENFDTFKKLGFSISEFGNNSFIVKTLPAVFGRLQVKEIVYELIEKLGKNKIDEIKEEIVTRMACRAAVMAGDELTILEFGNILKELATKKLPYTCPHGRPTMVKVTVDELEKKFRRKV